MGHDFLDHGEVGVAIKRALAGQQLVQNDARSEQISPRINGSAFQLLGRHVFERANYRALGASHVARVLDARDAKIRQLDAPTGLHQQIGGLDVTVNNFLLMRVLKRRQQVPHDAHGLLKCVGAAFVKVVLEVVALYKLHHQKSNVAIAVRVVHTHNVRVLQAGSRPRLGAKAHFVVGRGLVRQVFNLDGFDGDAAVQVGVTPLVHQPHCAFSEDADQIVAT